MKKLVVLLSLFSLFFAPVIHAEPQENNTSHAVRRPLRDAWDIMTHTPEAFTASRHSEYSKLSFEELASLHSDLALMRVAGWSYGISIIAFLLYTFWT